MTKYASSTFGLEVILPKQTHMDKLDRVHKKFLKHILSLPTSVAYPAIYVLNGAVPKLPIESVVHKRALVLYRNICRLEESSIQKQLARRQLALRWPTLISVAQRSAHCRHSTL